jgi:phage terminase large subunit-like protein
VDRRVAALLGWQLFPWQQYVVDVGGEYDPATNRPRYRTVGVGVARQNGKTSLVCVRIARQLIATKQTVAYTAQDRSIAYTKWSEHVELLMETPFKDHVDHIDRTNHREMLVMKNGGRYMPVTPSAKKAARSLSIDLAVIDEAHAHDSMEVAGALNPTMATRPKAQLWVLSNAGNERSELWKHYTQNGRGEVDNPKSTMAWFEWCADPGADSADREGWMAANPSMGLPGGVLEAAVADGLLGMDDDTFRREHLNIWAEASDLTAIDPIAWAGCRDLEVALGATVVLALEFTPERDRGTLVAVGQVGDRVALEVVEHTPDLDFLLARTVEVARGWNAPVTIDRTGPAASAHPLLTRTGCAIRYLNGTDVSAACGAFHDAALAGVLAHHGDPRLNDAVSLATKRQVGDRWVWQRRASGDISPLMAATLGHWAVLTTVPVEQPAVY